jgi:hypothetical protein
MQAAMPGIRLDFAEGVPSRKLYPLPLRINGFSMETKGGEVFFETVFENTGRADFLANARLP